MVTKWSKISYMPDFLSSPSSCSMYCEWAVDYLEPQAGQLPSENDFVRFQDFLQRFLDALEESGLDCLSRYAFRKAVHKITEIVDRNDSGNGLQAAAKFAKEFSDSYPPQSLRNCNLLSLVRGKGEDAVALLNELGAFREPNDITVILFLADLSRDDFNKYRERYNLLTEFDQIDPVGIHAWLLDNSARVSDKVDLQALLCYAAENGQRSVVAKILNKLEGHSRVDYRLALSYALLSGQREIIQLFVERQLVDPTDLNQSICWPRGKYHNNVINDIQGDFNDIQGGCDTCLRLPDNITPLAHAALTANIDMIRCLMLNGSNPYQSGCQIDSPIGLAYYEANEECLRLMLRLMLRDKVVPIGPCTRDRSTLLHIAATHLRRKEDVAIMDALLQRGADINARCDAGETPLIRASQGDNLSAVMFLLGKNASVKETDNVENRNALQWATIPEIAKLLAEEGELLYNKDIHGETALAILACYRGGIPALLPRYNQEREEFLSSAFWHAIRCACPDDAKFLLDSLSKENDLKFLVKGKTWNIFAGSAKVPSCRVVPTPKWTDEIMGAIKSRFKTMGAEEEEKLEKRMDELLHQYTTGNARDDEDLLDDVDTARKLSKLANQVQQLFQEDVQGSTRVAEPIQVGEPIAEPTQGREQRNFLLHSYKTMIVLVLIWFYCSPSRLKVSILYIVFTSLASQFLADVS